MSWQKELQVQFIESSAKDDTNVNEIFFRLARSIQEILDSNATQIDGNNGINLKLKNETNKSGCC